MVAEFAALNGISEMRSHLQLMVRIQSNLGLRLVDTKTQEKYPQAVFGKEVHYLKMEGVLSTADLRKSIWNMREIFKTVDVDPEAEVSDWTIVDFDNFLRGNPHE